MLMKTSNIISLLSAALLSGALLLFAGCEKEKPNNKNSTTDELYIDNVHFTDCISQKKHHQKGSVNPDSITVKFENNTIFITHYYMNVNCAWQDIIVQCRLSNDSIFVNELEQCPVQADCFCETNNSFEIKNIKSGRKTLVLESCVPVYCQTFNFQ